LHKHLATCCGASVKNEELTEELGQSHLDALLARTSDDAQNNTGFPRLDGKSETWHQYFFKNKRLIRKVDVTCADSHKWGYFYQIADFPGLEPQGYWNKCPCNEMDAIQRRHFIPNLPDRTSKDGKEVQRLYLDKWREMERLLRDGGFNYVPVTHKVVMAHTRPSIKKRYERAWYDIRERRTIHNGGTSRISAFVKFEKIPIGKIEDGKAPRLIQFRDYKYLYSFKRAFLPITLAIKECTQLTKHGQPLNTVFTKNYPGHAIGELISQAWLEYEDAVAICLDHKCFDGHFMTDHMKVAHMIWNALSKSKLLKRLLNEQLWTRLVTQCGIYVKASGKRASGEYTTSDENGTSNYNMINAVLSSLGLSKFHIFVNGDDSIIIMERKVFTEMIDMDVLINCFRYLNMETTLDRIAYSVEEISYCQCSPIFVSGMCMMVKTPLRAMSRLCYTDKLYTGDTLRRYYGSLGLCELAVSSGVPLLQPFALWLISQSRGSRPIGGIDKTVARSFNPGSLQIKEIADSTRNSFAKAFGISTQEQLRIEGYFAGNTIRTTNLYIERYKNFHLN
jgi:hypothetical protein